MARIFMDGFETGRPAGSHLVGVGGFNGSLWQSYYSGATTASTLVVSTSIKKTGGYSLYRYYYRINSYRRNLLQTLAEHYGRAEIYVSRFAATPGVAIFMNGEDENVIASIRFSGSGELANLHLYIGDSEVASLSEAFVKDDWVRIEWRLLVDDTSGIFEVKINGNSVLSFNGDTTGLSTSAVRWLALGTYINSDVSIYYDDVAINDTTGTENNSWVGRGYIYLTKPKGIGNYSQWTPSNETYDNWEMVNTIPDDGDTTYVESETPGHRDSYEMETIEDALGAPLEESVVKAVQHVFKGRYEDAHAAVEPFVRIGAVDYDLDPATDMQNAYYRYWDRVLNVNPATSAAWTQEAFDGMEAGVKFDDSE